MAAAPATASEATENNVFHLGTRRSDLALIQVRAVIATLQNAHPQNHYEVNAINTMGDKNKVTALHDFAATAAKSLWTFELEDMLLKGEVDMIVHCLKDIPTQIPEECDIGAILAREDPRDALVMHPSLPPSATLASLPIDSTIGTSSLRRSAQLKRLYPHLRFQNIRGNVDTRLRKLDQSKLEESKGTGSKLGDKENPTEDGTEAPPQYSAIVLAAAGLHRMGLHRRISKYMSSKDLERVQNTDGTVSQKKGMLYAVGQGALAIEIRKGDKRVLELLNALNHEKTWLEGMAERSVMRALEGGCSVPIGVESEWGEPTGPKKDELTLRAIVVSLDGLTAVEYEDTATVTTTHEATEFGLHIAGKLVEQGAEKILSDIKLDRGIVKEGDNA